jgi:hypothetical protein
MENIKGYDNIAVKCTILEEQARVNLLHITLSIKTDYIENTILLK